MTEDQSADLAAVLAEQAPEEKPELVPENAVNSGTSAEAAPQSSEAAPGEAGEGSVDPQSDAVVQPLQRYNENLQRIMEKARSDREKQVLSQGGQEDLDLARRIQDARQYGPEAVLKAAGLEPPAPKAPSISDLLGLEEDDEPPAVKELRKKMEAQEAYLKKFEEFQQQQLQQQQMQQQQSWEAEEQNRISGFIDNSSNKYSYVSALKPFGSGKDMYNGLISMYNQGYSPTYEDMAELIESRVEGLLDSVAQTPKFSNWLEQRFGVKVTPSGRESKTLTGDMGADSATVVKDDELSDEENFKLALADAQAAKEKALKSL